MLAFQIEINGERAVLAGVEDWHLLSFHLDAMRNEDTVDCHEYEVDLSIGGMTVSDEQGVAHHFRWGRRALVLGDVVTIGVVDAEAPDPVRRRYRSDRDIQECAFTPEEMRQMRYEDYIRYKAEFEPDGQ